MKKTFLLLLVFSVSFLTPSLFAQGKLSGLIFGDYYYNTSRDASISTLKNVATKGVQDFQAFQFRRIYLTYDNKISKKFKTRVRFEMSNNVVAQNGKFTANIKDAYLQWKAFAGQTLVLGLQSTPSFSVSEKYWKYRSLEKTIMDLRKIESSRDLGVGLKGKLDKKGVFSYWVLIGNGNSNKPETNKYKRYYLQLKISPVKNLSITLNGDFSPKGNIRNPYLAPINSSVSNGTFTSSFFIGYKSEQKYSFGVETFIQSSENSFNNGASLENKNSFGISVFGNLKIKENLYLVGRYDYFDPNTNVLSKGDSRNYILAGLDFKVQKQVSIMPNIQIETYETPLSSNSINASVTGRITFYYKFL